MFSVDELKIHVEQTVSNPFLYAQLAKYHKDNIEAILTKASPSGRPKKTAKRRRAAAIAGDVDLPPEAAAFRKQLESAGLRCWECVRLSFLQTHSLFIVFFSSYPSSSASFMRAPRNSDINVIMSPVCSVNPMMTSCSISSCSVLPRVLH